jgi:predicted O-methyltransferase YrrM
LTTIREVAGSVRGWLTPREIDFLVLLASRPIVPGAVIEFGTYCGKSTIALAHGVRLAGAGTLTTVDPVLQPTLLSTLAQSGIADVVTIRTERSLDFLSTWDAPIRLLWHDGANRSDSVRADLQHAARCFVDGTVVALHDVLNPSGERLDAFVREVLDSPHFGPVGLCGSIGWGCYFTNPDQATAELDLKRWLQRRLVPLRPWHRVGTRGPRGPAKLLYKLLRARVPHAAIDPPGWEAVVRAVQRRLINH